MNEFGFGSIFIQGTKELFNLDISVAGYYMIFFIVGLGLDIVGLYRRSQN